MGLNGEVCAAGERGRGSPLLLNVKKREVDEWGATMGTSLGGAGKSDVILDYPRSLDTQQSQ